MKSCKLSLQLSSPDFFLNMARTRRRCLHLSSRQHCFTPSSRTFNANHKQNRVSSSCEMDLKGATCSVCMEPPHNAVLLLCSSHDKGCRPYMCNTNYHHSNCLELFKKANTISMSTDPKIPPGLSSAIYKLSKSLELPCPQCPLCRGQVKGWTVIGTAREYLNSKKRSCMQGNCSFVGTFVDLQKHIRKEHPFAGPQEADPELEKKWREFVLERERQDVISSIRSTMPNSIILGDYVIDREDVPRGIGNVDDFNVYQDLNNLYYDRIAYGIPRVRRHRRLRRKRLRGRWMLGFRPSFLRFAWNRM